MRTPGRLLSHLFALISIPLVRASCGCRAYDPNFAGSCVPRGTCNSCIGPVDVGGACTSWVAPTACPSGQYNSGAGTACTGTGSAISCSLGTCLPCNCGLGAIISFCDSVFTANATGGQSNLVCAPCSKPTNAQYLRNNSCDFTCNTGYSGTTCTACIASCPNAGTYLAGTCSQTLNGILDSVPQCAACGLPNVASYSSGCTISTCINGHQLVANACVPNSPPPSPPPPPPRPPPPPSPPSPPPLAMPLTAECANAVTNHWFGATPVFAYNGAVSDSAGSGNNAVLVGGTLAMNADHSLNFTGTQYAETQTKIIPSSNSIQIYSKFKPYSTSKIGIIWKVVDSLTTTTQTVQMQYNTNSTVSVIANTASGVAQFTSSTTCAVNTYCYVMVTCTKYFSSCYIS